MSNYPNAYALAIAVARELTRTTSSIWEVDLPKDPAEAGSFVWATIKRGDGNTAAPGHILVRPMDMKANGGRYYASVCFPMHDSRKQAISTYAISKIAAVDSVTVAASRGVEAFAKAIMSRLLPGCAERWTACLDAITRADECGNKLESNIAKFIAAGGRRSNNETRMVMFREEQFRHSPDVIVSEESVRFDRFDVDIETGLRIIALLKKGGAQ